MNSSGKLSKYQNKIRFFFFLEVKLTAEYFKNVKNPTHAIIFLR